MKSIKKDVMKYSPFLRLYMEHLVDLIQNLQRAVRCVLKRGVCSLFFLLYAIGGGFIPYWLCY